MNQPSRGRPDMSKSWAELCCLDPTCLQLFWSRVVVRKWLNISATDSDFSADTSDDDADDAFFDHAEETPRLKRQNSETLRSEYTSRKGIRICVGTWNVGGVVPPDDLDIDEWLEVSKPADLYVLGLQEIVPLSAGNIFGSEDSHPILKWENIIRGALSRIHCRKKYKSFSDPASPSTFRPPDDTLDAVDEILLSRDGYGEVEVHSMEEDPSGFYEGRGIRGNTAADDDTLAESVISSASVSNPSRWKHFSPKGIDKLRPSRSSISEKDKEEAAPLLPSKLSKASSGTERIGLKWPDPALKLHSGKDEEESAPLLPSKLSEELGGTERFGLSWPEPPLNLLARHIFDRACSFGLRTKSLKSSKSIRTYGSSNSRMKDGQRTFLDISRLAEDLEKLIYRRRKSEYVRIVSKQMVGIFITIWVRRGLRKHVKNLKVSTVGVGAMGYIGNKGSISVSLSIYQTLFCFICTHLSSGEKDGDELKRNSDVYEIHRRTRFYHSDGLGFPQNIHDHERIIWLGDLNYRINLPYQETRKLISKRDWARLFDRDQLKQELEEGRAFDGWFEGTLDFPPTYKYVLNSEKYVGEDSKAGRRNPAWCDRILSYGDGIELLNYNRAELKLSDHRPVSATFVVEVEDFCPRKLQRALTLTNAELEKQDMTAANMGTDAALN